MEFSGLIEIEQNMIITKIRGEEAEIILEELENGAGIYFQITMDEG